MKIICRNFRCHEDATFEFPDTGLVLLSGDSGAGKSSVLAAFVYALYGKLPGKIRKPYTHGKKDCCVTVEYLGMTIVRTKPKTVSVTYDGVDYEDNGAQGVIEQTLGCNYAKFMAGSFIVQRHNISVLSMTPTEQLRFIEQLAFSNNTHLTFKQDVKEETKKENDLKLMMLGEVEVRRQQLENEEMQYDQAPDVPAEITDGYIPDDVRQEVVDLDRQLADLNKKMAGYQSQLSKARVEEKKKKEISDQIQKLMIEKAQCISMKNVLTPELSSDEIKEMETTIAGLQEQIDKGNRRDDYLKEKKRCDDLIRDHKTAAQKRLKEIEGQVLSEGALTILQERHDAAIIAKQQYDEAKAHQHVIERRKAEAKRRLSQLFTELKETFSLTQPVKTVAAMMKILGEKKVEIGERLNRVNAPKRSEPVRCPSCECWVRYHPDEGLTPYTEGDELDEVEVDDDTSTLETLIATIDRKTLQLKEEGSHLAVKVEEIKTPDDDPNDLAKQIMKATALNEEQAMLSKQTLPPSLQKMKSKLNKMEADGVGDKVENIDEASNQWAQLTTDLEAAWKTKAEHSSYTLEIKRREQQIRTLDSSLLSLNVKGSITTKSETIEAEISKLQQRILNMGYEVRKRKEILDNVAEYEEYQKHLERVEQLKDALTTSRAKLAAIERRLDGDVGLEATGKEAEILALEKTIEEINQHAQVYLSHMVFKDSIAVRLENVKDDGKKIKAQMHTVVDYGGERYSDIDEISGGEWQRCELAFMLSVNNLVGGAVLMLDECLNNLDPAINFEIINYLKDLCSDRLILVISHECVQGPFDEEVAISH